MLEKQLPSYPLRMPQELREQLAEVAKNNGRSMNAEIVARLALKPIRYHLQVHTNPKDHAVWHMESNTPIPAIAVGDRFNHHDLDAVWDPEPKEDQAYRVKDVAHIFSERPNYTTHILQVYLEMVDL